MKKDGKTERKIDVMSRADDDTKEVRQKKKNVNVYS